MEPEHIFPEDDEQPKQKPPPTPAREEAAPEEKQAGDVDFPAGMPGIDMGPYCSTDAYTNPTLEDMGVVELWQGRGHKLSVPIVDTFLKKARDNRDHLIKWTRDNLKQVDDLINFSDDNKIDRKWEPIVKQRVKTTIRKDDDS